MQPKYLSDVIIRDVQGQISDTNMDLDPLNNGRTDRDSAVRLLPAFRRANEP